MIKIKHLPLALLLCLIVNLGFSQNYFEEGKKEYYASNNSKAIELFTKAILNDQEMAKSLMYRGAAKIFLGQFDEALADLESSKKIDSTSPKLYFYFGKLYLIGGKPDIAIPYYSKVIALNPRDSVALTASAYDERGGAKAITNDLVGALADLNAAIALDSTKENFYTDRGYTRILLKQYEAAIKDINQSLKIEPNHKAYADRGLALSMTNQHQKAIEDYTKALEFIHEDGEVLYLRGISYKALGKKAEACADLNKSNELGYPKSGAVLKELKCDQFANLNNGQNYFKAAYKEFEASNYSHSVELFTKAILNDQEIAKSLMYRGCAKAFLHQFEDALTDLESSKQVDSTYPLLYYYFGKYYLLTGNFDLAISNDSRTIDSDPRNPDPWFDRAISKGQINDLEGALTDVNMAISIDSMIEDYYTLRGYTRILQKQYKNSFDDFNRSLKIKPNQKAYANRGLAWSMLDQHQKAIEDYTKALELNHQDGDTYYLRGISYKALSKKAEACADLNKSSELGYPQADAALKELKCDQ